MAKNKVFKTMDGNEAAAYVSYAFTEVATIYPITPSSPMADHVDAWATNGKKNLFGQPVKLVEMQAESGAAGAMHGSLETGSLTSTYTVTDLFLGKIGVSVSEEHLRAGDFSQYDGMFLAPDGFSREITLIDYGLTNDTEKFVTEITIPVREA